MQQSWLAGCRWASKGWEGVKAAGRLFNALAAKDQWGRPVRARLLFLNAGNFVLVDLYLAMSPAACYSYITRSHGVYDDDP